MSDLANMYPALRTAPVMKGMVEAHFRGLLRVMKQRKLAPEEVLFHQGYRGDSMAVIADGMFRVTVATKDGGQTQVGTMKAGEVVGEMACVDPDPRSATVTAATPAVVLLLNRPMLMALRTKGPPVLRAIMTGVIGQVTERIRRTNTLLEQRISGLAPMVGRVSHAGRSFPEADALRPSPYRGSVDLNLVSALREFSIGDKGVLASVARHLEYPPGALLCREGSAGTSCFIVVDGEVEVHKEVEGEPKLLAALSHCLLGQMALVDPSPRSATLRARNRVVALELSRDTFEQLLGENTPFAMQFQDTLAVTGIRQLREATDRLAEASKARPKPRPEPTPAVRPERPVARRPAPRPSSHDPLKNLPSLSDVPEGAGGGRMPGRGAGGTATSGRPQKHRLRTFQDVKTRDINKEIARPRNEREAKGLTLAYMQASLKEWGMSMDDLDSIQVSRPDGVMSAAERRSRQNR
jgi:CRP/FNR family transcriptional regulator, cyclic AMP receptor protein